MEFASVLAGESWSDHPGCTDRALAELARRVNDDVRADARPALATLAPRLVGAVGRGPATDVVVAAIARVGLEALPGDPVMRRVERRARVRLARTDARTSVRTWAALVRCGRTLGGAGVGGAYAQLGRTLRGVSRTERDDARIRALALAVEDVRRHVGAWDQAPGPCRSRPGPGGDVPARSDRQRDLRPWSAGVG